MVTKEMNSKVTHFLSNSFPIFNEIFPGYLLHATNNQRPWIMWYLSWDEVGEVTRNSAVAFLSAAAMIKHRAGPSTEMQE